MPASSRRRAVGLVAGTVTVAAASAAWWFQNSAAEHLAVVAISRDGESVYVVRLSGVDGAGGDTSSVVSHVYVLRAVSGEVVATIAVPGFRTIYVESNRETSLDGLVLAGVMVETEVGAVTELSVTGEAVSRQCEVPGVSVAQRRGRGGAILSVSTPGIVDVLGASGVSCSYRWDGCVELACDKGGGTKMLEAVPPSQRGRAMENTERVLRSMRDGIVGISASATLSSLYDECFVEVLSGATVVERRVEGAGVGTALRTFLGPVETPFLVASTGACGGAVVAADDRGTWLWSDEGWRRLE